MILQLQELQDAGQYSGLPELSAAILQLVVTLGLAWLCATLHRVYRKPVYAWWSIAWLLYLVRLTAIVIFLIHRAWIALYWHQVLTGWTALAVLGTATVFARGGIRRRYIWLAIFPPLWSYFAIYRLASFGWAAAPAVAFLSAATLLTGVVFWRYARRVQSTGATVLAVAFVLWGLHHLDYPFLRPRGAWVPWGYSLDIVFELAVGAGILLLVADDLRRGLDALTTLSGELQSDASRPRPALLDALLARPLTLPAVRGAALYSPERGTYERGAGVCGGWQDREPSRDERARLDATVATGKATTHSGWFDPDGVTAHPFAAVLPVADAQSTTGALVIVGEARAPFAVLDETFLTALGQQVGGALANAALTERLRQRSTDLERLSTRMVHQHEEERRRLSRELHDETAQVLSALKIELGVLRRIVPAADQDRVDDASALVDAGIRSIRAVTNELRPALLDDLGLVPALRSLVTAFAAHSDATTSLDAPVEGSLPPLSADAELALFRALQEGLANVARHAQARRVDVSIAASDGVVTLLVADDGVGFPVDTANSGAMGLTGMRERVAALGGTVNIDSTAENGTCLRITLDVEAPQ
jgi:signal transduction histidine kinase